MKIDIGKIDKGATNKLRLFPAYLRRPWLHCFVIAVIGFAVHLPAMQGELIWDDEFLARDNPFMKSPILAAETFRHYLFIESYCTHYRPVQNLSYMVDYLLWNTNTYGFHLTNVILHLLSGIGFYLLLRKLLPSLGKSASGNIDPKESDFSLVAFGLAALWTVHPAHSAAVDYISGRADSLAFAFATIAWLLVLKTHETRHALTRFFLGAGAVLSGLLAFCSRESGLIWAGLFILHTCFFRRNDRRRSKTVAIAICLAVVTAYFGLRDLVPSRSVETPTAEWSAPVRAVLILRALGDYGRILFFPTNLHMERTVFFGAPLDNQLARAEALTLEYLAVAGALMLLGFFLFALRRGRGQQLRIFGAIWFVGAFLPISNIIDLNATVAEHWMYLPSAGLLIFLAGCVLDLPRPLARLSAITLPIIILLLGARAFERSSDWVSPKRFYQRTAQAGGTSCRVTLNLAGIYCAEGNFAEGERLYRIVLKLQPDYTIARNNLADALLHLGREDEARQVLAEAASAAHETRRDYPRTWVASLNYAHCLDSRNETGAALDILEKARADYPENWELIAYESELYRRSNDLECAIELVRPFAEKCWWHYSAWMALGRLSAAKGDVDLAERALRHASWLDLRSTEPLNLIAWMEMLQNHLPDAVATQRRAVARQPQQPRQYMLLSDILTQMGRADEARAALAQVSHLRSLADAKTIN